MSLYNNENLPNDQKKLTKKIKFKEHKNYVCGKCNHKDFQLIQGRLENDKIHFVCSHCDAIANEDGTVIPDNNPSHLLMTLKVRK